MEEGGGHGQFETASNFFNQHFCNCVKRGGVLQRKLMDNKNPPGSDSAVRTEEQGGVTSGMRKGRRVCVCAWGGTLHQRSIAPTPPL